MLSSSWPRPRKAVRSRFPLHLASTLCAARPKKVARVRIESREGSMPWQPSHTLTAGRPGSSHQPRLESGLSPCTHSRLHVFLLHLGQRYLKACWPHTSQDSGGGPAAGSPPWPAACPANPAPASAIEPGSRGVSRLVPSCPTFCSARGIPGRLRRMLGRRWWSQRWQSAGGGSAPPASKGLSSLGWELVTDRRCRPAMSAPGRCVVLAQQGGKVSEFNLQLSARSGQSWSGQTPPAVVQLVCSILTGLTPTARHHRPLETRWSQQTAFHWSRCKIRMARCCKLCHPPKLQQWNSQTAVPRRPLQPSKQSVPSR